MMPRVDISEVILEVLGWCPQFLDSRTSIAGNPAHLADLDISVAACLTAQALNITYAPIAVPGSTALARHRLGYVEHTFLRADNYAAACPHLVTAQAGHRVRPGVGRWAGRGHRRDRPGGALPIGTAGARW